MATVELFRFRSVRPIQNKTQGYSALQVKNSGDPVSQVVLAQFNDGIGTLLGTCSWLMTVSEQLAAADDLVSPAALIAMLPPAPAATTDPPIWTTQVAAWGAVQQNLSNIMAWLATKVRTTPASAGNYGIPVIPTSLTQDIELVSRFLLLMDTLETLANDQTLPAAQQQLQNEYDIQLALTFRSTTLPADMFSSTPPVLARAPGVTDLQVVRDEWNRYIPDQIANVVNVLPGESFDSGSGHLEETVNSQSTTNTQTTTQTTENSQTQSATLAATTSSDASMNIGVHGQVEVSGQYGPTTVKTNIGGQAQFSQSSSASMARTTAMETVARAVKTVSETITQVQTSRTTIKDTSHEEHKLQNTGSEVVVGMYRWLSIVHRSQIVSYPNRFIVEFEIPEPGAWLRWALTNQPTTPWDNPDPGPFAVNRNDPTLDPLDPSNPDTTAPALQPSGITPAVASGLAARWRIQGLTPPPPTTVTLGMSYTVTQSSPPILNDNSISVPTGYVAMTWNVDVASAGGDDPHPTNLRITVGGAGTNFTLPGGSTATVMTNAASGNVGSINTGVVPVYIAGFYTVTAWGIAANVTVTCGQIDADSNGNGVPYLQWQQATFDQIVAAYDALLSAHNQERDARLQQQTGTITVGPPQLNLAQSVAELKRLAIQNLLGQTFTGYDLLTIDPTSGEPSLDPSKTVTSNPVIQFFEQAFEWENIVYICYPYFWGGKLRWVQNATSATADPVFDQFLNAGSVRLVVPARPGFEQVVNFFLYTSSIWSGQNPPGPNDPDYLSVADEIQSIQAGATDGTPIGDPWEYTLPTTLLWAGTDPTTLPSNPDATIGPPPSDTASTGTGTASVTVTGSSNPGVYGQPVTLAVTVAPAVSSAPAPTGQVGLQVDGQSVPGSPFTLSAAGTASSAALASLAPGTHAVTAVYTGDSNYAKANGMLTLTVNPAATAVAVSSSANPSPRNTTVAFTGVVSAKAPAAGVPAGQINILIDGTATSDSPLTLNATGSATCAAVNLSRGSHNVTVNYLGNTDFAAGTGSLSQTAR